MSGRRSKSIFGEARFRVLRTIYFAGANGAGLREIAYRTSLSVGTVQAALRSLRRTKSVRLRREQRRLLFFPNEASVDWPILSMLFEQTSKEQIYASAQSDSPTLAGRLASLDELFNFGKRIRKARSEA